MKPSYSDAPPYVAGAQVAKKWSFTAWVAARKAAGKSVSTIIFKRKRK